MSEQELRLIEGIDRRVANLEILEGVQDNSDLDFAIPSLTLGLANAEGALDTLLRSDATLIAQALGFGVGVAPTADRIHAYRDDASTIPTVLIEQDGAGDAAFSVFLTGGQVFSFGIDNSVSNAFIISAGANLQTSPLVAIEPGGDVGINVTNPRVKLQIVDTSTFDPDPSSDTVELFLYDVSAGAGKENFGAAIGFTGSARGLVEAAIVAYQSDDDVDETGLVFFVHESTNEAIDMVEAMRITHDQRVGINLGVAPAGQVHVVQDNNAAAIPVMALNQDDDSEGFWDLLGNAAASAVGPISLWTAGNNIQGFVRVEINGAAQWFPFYDAPTA